MSRYTTVATGWNNNRHKPIADPPVDDAADISLSRVWPAVVAVPGRGDFFACVLVEAEDTFYVEHTPFQASAYAMAVAVARARARMEGTGDG